MLSFHALRDFAASYNCGSYGSDSFNSPSVCGASITNSLTGALSNTGIDVIIPASIALVAILVSITMLVRKKRRN